MRARVTSHRETRVSPLGISLLLWIYRVFGQRCCRWCISLVVACAWPFLGKVRAVSALFIRKWRAYTGQQRGISSYEHLRTFAYTLADRLACRAGLFDMSRVRICTPDAYESLCRLYYTGQGVFCITSHLGCFDMLRVLFDCTREGMKGEMHVFMDTAATQAFAQQQRRYGKSMLDTYVHPVQELGPVLSMQMMEKLEQGAMLIMAGDRVWRDEESANYRLPFLGADARFPKGCFRWAAALGCPVYTFCLVENGGGYDLHVECLSSTGETKATSLVSHFAAHLEQLCCRYPANWFNFYNFWK